MSMMKRFDAYLSRLCKVLGHADREEPMREYCTGLMLPLERKSVEPIAAHVGPQAVSVSKANALMSLPLAYRLYLPQEWVKDAARRKTAKVPQEFVFATKPRI